MLMNIVLQLALTVDIRVGLHTKVVSSNPNSLSESTKGFSMFRHSLNLLQC